MMDSTFFPLPDRKYEIIYADPPWDYAGQPQHAGTTNYNTSSAVAFYPTVKLKVLKTLDVDSIAADDSLLFMWATSPHMDQAIELGKAWGFNWATIAFIWDKIRLNPGFYTMSQCELCLVFKKGRIPKPRGARNIHQLIREERTEHSVKPQEARRRIEQMFPQQSKIELFARANPAIEGWDFWGLEAN